MRLRNPFRPNSLVRFRYCSDLSCDCHTNITADEGDTGTVRERRGKVIIVDFDNRHEGFMQWEVGFRIHTAKMHLELINDPVHMRGGNATDKEETQHGITGRVIHHQEAS